MVRRYRLAGQLGKGGMAEVLEAHALGEAGFERRVAIKRMLPSALGDPSFGRMFLDEARIASRLHHANIVSIVDYGMVDGVPFQVLEFVDGIDGRTLVRKAPDGSVPIELALYVCAQVGHALSHAHSARDADDELLGIVHRDVSPGNVLVSWEGDVKLADFGIAFARNRLENTEFGMTKGTPAYMSPEQAIGAPVDVRADIFSLGCVLHALLAGRSPLADGAHLDFFTTRELAIDASVPEDARAIIRQATFFDREERFRSASALTEALGQALAARAVRDPRMAMKGYLARLRPSTVPRAAKLDELFAVEIVLEDDASDTRRFSAIPDVPASRTLPEPKERDDGARPSQRSAGTEGLDTNALERAAGLHRPRSVWPVVGVVAVAVLALGAFSLHRLWTGTEPEPSAKSAPRDDSPRTSGAAREMSSVPLAPSASASPPIAASPVATTPSTKAFVAPPRSSAAGEVEPSSRTSGAPGASAVAPPGSDCAGTIYLNCPASNRAQVMLDGVARPDRSGDRVTSVPCGPHTITFVDALKGRSAVALRVDRGQLTTAACTFTD